MAGNDHGIRDVAQSGGGGQCPLPWGQSVGLKSVCDNPADLITRGAPPSELCINSFWQNGPQWLYLPENEWPMSKEISQKCQGEVIALQRKTFTKITTISQAKNQAENEALVGGNL